jgi:Ribbon-helix-helix protein, copG family
MARRQKLPARGRPPLPEGEALSTRCTVRLSPDEAQALAQLAERLGCSEAQALRQALALAAAGGGS